MMKMTEDDAYEDGGVARHVGISLGACPWPILDKKLRTAWMSGWIDADVGLVDIANLEE